MLGTGRCNLLPRSKRLVAVTTTQLAPRAAVLEDFDGFVAAHGVALKRYALALTGSDPDADDILQSALIKLYLSWERIEHPEAALSYAKRIVARAAASHWRRPARREFAAEITDSGRAVQDSSEREAMWSLLAMLPPRQRAVVVLRFYEDLTEADIADHLGISVGTVKSQLSRALASLRVHVREESR